MKFFLMFLCLLSTTTSIADEIIDGYEYSCDYKVVQFEGSIFCNGRHIFALNDKPVSKDMKIFTSRGECSSAFVQAGGTYLCDGKEVLLVEPPIFGEKTQQDNIPKECYVLTLGFYNCDDLKISSAPFKQCCRFDPIFHTKIYTEEKKVSETNPTVA